MSEELRIEWKHDPTIVSKPRAVSSVFFHQQVSKERHPGSKFSIDQAMNEQCAKYPHFAAKMRLGKDVMRPHSSKISCKGYQGFSKKIGRVPMGPKGPGDLVVEQGHYNPNYEVGTRNDTGGYHNMDAKLSRTRLPSGRP